MLSAEERALEREAKKGMNEEEAVFSVESALEQTYEWSDKYRPRKPRYGARGGGGGEHCPIRIMLSMSMRFRIRRAKSDPDLVQF